MNITRKESINILVMKHNILNEFSCTLLYRMAFNYEVVLMKIHLVQYSENVFARNKSLTKKLFTLYSMFIQSIKKGNELRV